MEVHRVLLCVFNPHFHPLTCHHRNKTRPSTTFITTYIICFHRGAELSTEQIGTVLKVVSHLEATQAGGKMRGDVSECSYSQAHSCVEGIKLNLPYF